MPYRVHDERDDDDTVDHVDKIHDHTMDNHVPLSLDQCVEMDIPYCDMHLKKRYTLNSLNISTLKLN